MVLQKRHHTAVSFSSLNQLTTQQSNSLEEMDSFCEVTLFPDANAIYHSPGSIPEVTSVSYAILGVFSIQS